MRTCLPSRSPRGLGNGPYAALYAEDEFWQAALIKERLDQAEDGEWETAVVRERLAQWGRMSQAEKDRAVKAERNAYNEWPRRNGPPLTVPIPELTPEPEDEPAALPEGEPLAAFEMPMDGSAADVPTALLERKDGAALLYEGKLNFLFGTPGTGKSWVAMFTIQEALLRDRRVIYWDHEDSPGTARNRAALLGLDLSEYWREGRFKYLRPGPEDSDLAMAEALAWIGGGDGPNLLVIDSAESAGCPSDGSDVKPWLDKFILPFRNVGATVIALDHVPKRTEGRPMVPHR